MILLSLAAMVSVVAALPMEIESGSEEIQTDGKSSLVDGSTLTSPLVDGSTLPSQNQSQDIVPDEGKIMNQQEAELFCPKTCQDRGLQWNNHWKTTVWGQTSVCGCVPIPPSNT